MGQVAGRTTEPRVKPIGTTNTSAAITGAAGTFNEEDKGAKITAAGIPAATTILSVESDTAATLSANATATANPVNATITPAPGAYGFAGWSPESDAESEAYSVAAKNAGTAEPDRPTNANTPRQQRNR